MQHLSSHDLHLPQHQSEVVHKCPQLAWYMHGQPCKHAVSHGKTSKMLTNYNQKQNRTEPEVHVIDEHYGGRCWILATQSTEKLVLCSVSIYYKDGTCQTDLAPIKHIRHFSFRLVYCLCVANCSFTASKGLHGDTMLLFSMKLAMRNLVNVAHLPST